MTKPGVYVTRVMINGCIAEAHYLHEEEPKEAFTVFPNPFDKKIFVTLSEPHDPLEELIVFDLAGKEIRRLEVNSMFAEVQTNDLQEGLYLLTMRTRNRTYVKKIMKRK